jgi:hypothetical protein
MDETRSADGEQFKEDSITADQETYSKDEVGDLLKALHLERDIRKSQEKSIKESAAKLARLEQINPDEYERLQSESAKRAEFEAEFEAREAQRARQLEEIKSSSAQREQKLLSEIDNMRQHSAFERLFSSVSGKGGKFLDTAFETLKTSLRLESDGSFTIIDTTGDPVVDEETGKRVDPKYWLKSFKGDDFLGFCFEPEQGYGAGLMPASGQRRDSGTMSDFKGLSTSEIFARTFGKKH